MEPKTLKYLSPFVGKTFTAKDAATKLDVHLTTLLYQVNQLCRAGFLSYQEVARAGRPVKYYRASGEAYFVPYRLSPYASLEEWLLREYEPVEKAFLRNFVASALHLVDNPDPETFGLWITLNEERLQVRHGPHPDQAFPKELLGAKAPPLLNTWDDQLTLEFDDARALYAEMQDLLTRYRSKRGSGRYFVRLALSPIVT